MYSTLQALLMQSRGTVSGLFRLRDPYWGRTKHNQPYLRIRLEDSSTNIYAYSWQPDIYDNQNIIDLCCAELKGIIRWYADKKVIDISGIHVTQDKPIDDAVRLIPQGICPQPWLLAHLQGAVAKITIPPLQKFVAAVLGDDGIGFAFVSCPASLNHHHNYPGGLLMHSLDCFKMVEKHHNFPKIDYELGLVAALLHDIGKTLTMTHNMERTSIGASIEHDKLTFEVLGPFLRQLAREWPDGATQLRYLLNWKLRRNIPRYNMADLVACCDRMSTGLEMEKRMAS